MTKDELVTILKAPPFRKDNLEINITRYFTDVNGTIVDKNDLAIPDALKVEYPVYVFNVFDMNGAYNLGLKNRPPAVGVQFLCTFIYGITNPAFFGFSGVNTIQNKLKSGDIVTVYTDSIQTPNWFIWIVQNSSTKPLASFLMNLCNLPVEPKYGYVNSVSFHYYTNNELQWEQDILYMITDYVGLINTNNIDPSIYRQPNLPGLNMVEVKWSAMLTQYVGLLFYMLFDTDNITLNFQLRIKK